MGSYINYFITIIGLCIIIVSLFLIFSDRLKGEGLYFDLYVKEEEIKKAIADADEMIDELKYTSESIVNEVEQSINDFRRHYEEVREELNKANLEELKRVNLSHDSSDLNISTKSEKNMGEENRSKNKMDCVYEFYNKGMKIEEIAKELNMGKGEVSLILSMYNGVFKNGNV